jgi:hypothetical protein
VPPGGYHQALEDVTPADIYHGHWEENPKQRIHGAIGREGPAKVSTRERAERSEKKWTL